MAGPSSKTSSGDFSSPPVQGCSWNSRRVFDFETFWARFDGRFGPFPWLGRTPGPGYFQSLAQPKDDSLIRFPTDAALYEDPQFKAPLDLLTESIEFCLQLSSLPRHHELFLLHAPSLLSFFLSFFFSNPSPNVDSEKPGGLYQPFWGVPPHSVRSSFVIQSEPSLWHFPLPDPGKGTPNSIPCTFLGDVSVIPNTLKRFPGRASSPPRRLAPHALLDPQNFAGPKATVSLALAYITWVCHFFELTAKNVWFPCHFPLTTTTGAIANSEKDETETPPTPTPPLTAPLPRPRSNPHRREAHFQRFAGSQAAFFEAYARAHVKLSELGSRFQGGGPSTNPEVREAVPAVRVRFFGGFCFLWRGFRGDFSFGGSGIPGLRLGAFEMGMWGCRGRLGRVPWDLRLGQFLQVQAWLVTYRLGQPGGCSTNISGFGFAQCVRGFVLPPASKL